jgi:hypothetical protein
MKQRHCSGRYHIDLLTAVLEFAACKMSMPSDKFFPSPVDGQPPYALGGQITDFESGNLT